MEKVHPVVVQLWWEGQAALLAGDGVPHTWAARRPSAEEKDKPVAAVDDADAVALAERHGEASAGDAIWLIQQWKKRTGAIFIDEEAKERRLAVVVAEAALELGIGAEAAPTLANE